MMPTQLNLTQRPFITALIALMCGALFPLGLAPLGLWPLTLVSITAAAVLIRHFAGNRFLLGWLFGLGAFGVGTSWISASMAVSGTPALLSGLLTSLFCAGLALLFGGQFWLFSRLRVVGSAFEIPVFVALWILFEWLRSWLLTGFPWLYAGYAMTDTWLSGFAPVLGVFGISALLATLASVIAISLTSLNKRHIILSVALSVAIPAIGWSLQKIQWVSLTGNAIDTVIVQGNVDQKTKWDGNNIQTQFDRYLAQSLPHTDSDMIIWPEAAITALHSRATPFLDKLQSVADRTNTGFITGIILDPVVDGRRRFYNAAIGIGSVSGTYTKTRMVPFGEYVPFADIIRGLLNFFDLPMSALEPGPTDSKPLLIGDNKMGMLICYEIAYPAMARERARESDVIITISNDAWFGNTFGPYQHLEMARMRAMEVGRPVIRATQDGVSAFIDHRGQLLATVPKHKKEVVRTAVSLVTGETPFTKFGFLWQIGMGLLTVILALYRLKSLARRGSDTSASAH